MKIVVDVGEDQPHYLPMTNKTNDFGPGDIVTRAGSTTVYTVVALNGRDVLCALGRVRTGGLWRPGLYDMAFDAQTLTNHSVRS